MIKTGKSLAQLIQPWVQSACSKHAFCDARLLLDWPQIVGETWGKICTPEKVRFPNQQRSRGILYLKTKSATATQIAYGEPQILERVNQYYGYPAIARLFLRHA